jgi:hypothetical protein
MAQVLMHVLVEAPMSGRVVTGFLIAVLAAAPVLAADGQRRRGSDNRDNRGARAEHQARESDGNRVGHAVPRRDDRQVDVQRQRDWQRQQNVQRNYSSPRVQVQRAPRVYYYDRGRYTSRAVIVPRVIRPSIITVVPYQPYVYRPRLGLGAYYGSSGLYPYGYTPRGYYDPIPGRVYGGLKIKGAPREAQVFADGYYVGIVDDFDGVFQHLNLEAGPHTIEVQFPGADAISFDVFVQAGRTITLRADLPY